MKHLLLIICAFIVIGLSSCSPDATTFNNSVSTLPTLTTDSVSNITFTTAACGGNITSAGITNVSVRGVCWSKGSNPTIDSSKTVNGSGIGAFTSSMTGLHSATIYYIRAYATNINGTAYGNEVIFSTR